MARAAAREIMDTAVDSGPVWLPKNPRRQAMLCWDTLDAQGRGESVDPEILAWARVFAHSNTCQGFALAEGRTTLLSASA